MIKLLFYNTVSIPLAYIRIIYINYMPFYNNLFPSFKEHACSANIK